MFEDSPCVFVFLSGGFLMWFFEMMLVLYGRHQNYFASECAGHGRAPSLSILCPEWSMSFLWMLMCEGTNFVKYQFPLISWIILKYFESLNNHKWHISEYTFCLTVEWKKHNFVGKLVKKTDGPIDSTIGVGSQCPSINEELKVPDGQSKESVEKLRVI